MQEHHAPCTPEALATGGYNAGASAFEISKPRMTPAEDTRTGPIGAPGARATTSAEHS